MAFVKVRISYDKQGKPFIANSSDEGSQVIAGGNASPNKSLPEPKGNKGLENREGAARKEILTFNPYYKEKTNWKNKARNKNGKQVGKNKSGDANGLFFDSLLDKIAQVKDSDAQGVKVLFVKMASAIETRAGNRWADKAESEKLLGQAANMRVIAKTILESYGVEIPYDFDSETPMRNYWERILSVAAGEHQDTEKKAYLIRLAKTLRGLTHIAKEADMKSALDKKE